jgi:Transglutaminase-like superfamily
MSNLKQQNELFKETFESGRSTQMTPINTQAAWHPYLRPICKLLIGAQLAMVLQPLSAVMHEPGKAPVDPRAQAQVQRLADWAQRMEAGRLAKQREAAAPADKTSADLKRLDDVTSDLVADMRSRGLAPSTLKKAQPDGKSDKAMSLRAIGPDMRIEVEEVSHDPAMRMPDALRAERAKELLVLVERLQKSHGETLAAMDEDRRNLIGKKVSAEILARHAEAVASMRQQQQRFDALTKPLAAWDVGTPKWLEGVGQLRVFLEALPGTRTPSAKDPASLPWRTPEPTQRTPAETQTAWFQNLFGGERVRLAQSGGGSIGPLNFTVLPPAGSAPTEADLVETDEVKITAAIQAKAVELGNNPVKIHNWVRNTIEWVPTWGAIQTAQSTMEKGRGNAIDIASLEIALLRAAKIPARYQFGTIEVEADKLKNWVGGTTSTEAAQQIMSQGGIASRALVAGGRVVSVRMEHAWVQAYVNWAPSRGGKQGSATQHPNPNATKNAWVPLDAAYKQYQYAPGMDLVKQVPIDSQSLLSAVQAGATVNETEGWVQNINQVAIQSQLTEYQSRLKAHIDASAGGADATVGQVIGRRIIPQQSWELLPGTLANSVVLRGAQVAAVPQGLQHRFSFMLNAIDVHGYDGSNYLSYTAKLSQIEGKRLTLSYAPASQADADLIASYLPKPNADGSPIRPEQLPKSLPGYAIRLRPQIMLDGQVVASSTTSVTMGTDLTSIGGFTALGDPSRWDLTKDESHVAGQATAIGISAGGISVAQLERVKQRLQHTRNVMQSTDQVAISSLNGEQVSGDLLTATIWSWFAAVESQNRLIQNQAQMIENPGMSYGLFHAVAQPVISWGVVRQVEFPGVSLDIGHVRVMSWAQDNDRRKWIGYQRLRGQYMSALEHAIPERLFSNPSRCSVAGSTAPNGGLPACPRGVSAVQAIGVAAQAGQKVYTITREIYANSPSIVSGALSGHSSSTRSSVQNALNVGLEVTIHEKPVTIGGWSGAGYTTIDPNTGAGAYIIEGGSNGGFLSEDVSTWGAVIGLLIGFAGTLGAIASGIIGVILAIDQYLALAAKGDCAQHFADLSLGLNVAAFLAGGIAGIFGTLVLAVLVGLLMLYIGLFVGVILSMAADYACKVRGG